MKKLAECAKVIINCVGPYRHYGEAVVKACAAAGTDYVDITGEPEFIETMEYKYHEEAKKSGALIVSTCGFDSIPADMGVVNAVDTFGGTVNSVESFLQITSPTVHKANAGHYATWESAVHGIANAHILRKLRKTINAPKVDLIGPKIKTYPLTLIIPPKMPSPIYGFPVTFPGSDASVVKRSQLALQVYNIT